MACPIPAICPIEHTWDYLGQRVEHPTSLNELEARLQQKYGTKCLKTSYRICMPECLIVLHRALALERWVTSHMNVCGNEIADGLACQDSYKDSMHCGCLTVSEIATRVKQDTVPLGRRFLYMSGIKEAILVLLCLGQAVDAR
ncbi:hypothetical protein TNCV_3515771 [Trichonephila clavipes]|nr:hypothetical protein TNCV_3515771 [Trichonephila clavipes]